MLLSGVNLGRSRLSRKRCWAGILTDTVFFSVLEVSDSLAKEKLKLHRFGAGLFSRNAIVFSGAGREKGKKNAVWCLLHTVFCSDYSKGYSCSLGEKQNQKKKRKVSKSSVTLQEHFYGLRTLSSATPNTGWGPLFYIIFSIYSLFSSICSSSLPLSTTAWSWVGFVSQWLLSRRCRNTSHSCTKCVSFLLTLEPWLMMLLWIQCRQNAQLDLLLNELV